MKGNGASLGAKQLGHPVVPLPPEAQTLMHAARLCVPKLNLLRLDTVATPEGGLRDGGLCCKPLLDLPRLVFQHLQALLIS